MAAAVKIRSGVLLLLQDAPDRSLAARGEF